MSKDLNLDCTGQYAGRSRQLHHLAPSCSGFFCIVWCRFEVNFTMRKLREDVKLFWFFIRFEWHAVCMFETVVQRWMEREMAEKLGSEYIVDIIEATVRVLVGTGLSREQALQVMLSQLAVQVSPEVMKMAVCVSEKYAAAFNEGDWDPNSSSQKSTKCGTTKHPFAYL